MTIAIKCEPVPRSDQTYLINILENNNKISGWVGDNLYRMWADEQPGPRTPRFMRNQRYALKNGLVWRLRQTDDKTAPALEVILENSEKVKLLVEALKQAEITDTTALGAMQDQLQPLVASQPTRSSISSSSFGTP